MDIWFFEEYPDKKLPRGHKLIIAAKTKKEFENYRERCEEAIWWPVLETSTWVSPFASVDEIEKLKDELKRETTYMLDLELPIHTKKFHGKGFWKKKATIRALLKKETYSAEYPPSIFWPRWLLRALGVSYKTIHTPIMMYYTSMMPSWIRPYLRYALQRYIRRHPQAWVGLGTTATGVFGDEPELSAESLKQDLEYCRRIGVKTVVIYRLLGMSKEHWTVIDAFMKK